MELSLSLDLILLEYQTLSPVNPEQAQNQEKDIKT